MRALYERVLETSIYGGAHVPPFGGYIVAANHASHLDTGLVKYALGEQGDALVALAAKDYFFDDPVRRMYFENFTNLVPMERHGSLRESLRLAGEVIRDGYILLIFPEGTRSDTGVMADFKPSLGYLALTNKCGILPMYLAGTHDAMPKGRYLPKRGERVASYIGPYLSYEDVVKIARRARALGAVPRDHATTSRRRSAGSRRATRRGRSAMPAPRRWPSGSPPRASPSPRKRPSRERRTADRPPAADLLSTGEPLAWPLPLRPPSRKLALRVSGARLGSVARPAPDGQVAAGAVPTHRLGLRVHGASLARPTPAPTATSTVVAREDYATAEDYE